MAENADLKLRPKYRVALEDIKKRLTNTIDDILNNTPRTEDADKLEERLKNKMEQLFFKMYRDHRRALTRMKNNPNMEIKPFNRKQEIQPIAYTAEVIANIVWNEVTNEKEFHVLKRLIEEDRIETSVNIPARSTRRHIGEVETKYWSKAKFPTTLTKSELYSVADATSKEILEQEKTHILSAQELNEIFDQHGISNEETRRTLRRIAIERLNSSRSRSLSRQTRLTRADIEPIISDYESTIQALTVARTSDKLSTADRLKYNLHAELVRSAMVRLLFS